MKLDRVISRFTDGTRAPRSYGDPEPRHKTVELWVDPDLIAIDPGHLEAARANAEKVLLAPTPSEIETKLRNEERWRELADWCGKNLGGVKISKTGRII